MEIFKNPEFWSALLFGTAIFWMTFSSQWRDSYKQQIKGYKKNSQFLYKILDHAYDVQILVIKHNSKEHADGEGALEIPETPEHDSEG